MSLVMDGLLVYPLRQRRVQLGSEAVYDRDTREKSWFIVDLVLPGGRFIPAGADGLVTPRGEIFNSTSRYEEAD